MNEETAVLILSMKKEMSVLKNENKGLKISLKRRDEQIRKIQRSGPDAGLLKANVELMDEVNELKEKLGLEVKEGRRL